jgi:hypothetical protein
MLVVLGHYNDITYISFEDGVFDSFEVTMRCMRAAKSLNCSPYPGQS